MAIVGLNIGAGTGTPACVFQCSKGHANTEQEELPSHVEQGFFDKYWPSVRAASADQASTAASMFDESDKEDADASRVAKLAKTGTEKGGHPGKGPGLRQQGYGQRQSAGSYKRRDRDPAHKHQSWDYDEWSGWDTGNAGSSQTKVLKEEIRQLKESVFALQKAVLRHEDFGNCLKAELTWVMFLRLDMKASVLPSLFQMQQKWRELKESSPEKLTAPMRVDLVKALFKEFGSRLSMLPQQEAQMDTLIKLGWLSREPLKWHYVRWDADHERLRPDDAKEPVAHEKVAAVAGSIQQLAEQPGAVTRFHPSRDIVEKMGGKNLTMSLQTSIHGAPASTMREHLAFLSGLSVTQLVGILANLIQKHING